MMSKKSDLREFLDVSTGDGKTNTTYDILIDSRGGVEDNGT